MVPTSLQNQLLWPLPSLPERPLPGFKPAKPGTCPWHQMASPLLCPSPPRPAAKHLCLTDSLCFFLGPHLQHVEVPGLGVELELQLSAYIHHSHSRAGSKLRLRPTPHTAHANTRALTH